MNDRKVASAQCLSTRVPTDYPMNPNAKNSPNWRALPAPLLPPSWKVRAGVLTHGISSVRASFEELRAQTEQQHADLVIFSASLSPSQERNLERELCCRVLDRAGLILDIFAQRARSFEGKLQVELAQLRHLSTRLVRGWTHLERQKGGIGLRGPGETQLETDRRLIGDRIRQLKERLENVDARRTMNRRNRVRAEIPTVALVGYTNAGKSTLFNALTDADVYVKDQLFATLDPTVRRLDLPEGEHVVLAIRSASCAICRMN